MLKLVAFILEKATYLHHFSQLDKKYIRIDRTLIATHLIKLPLWGKS